MSQQSEPRNAEHERIAVKAALNWSGWGSPVGMSILLVSVGVFLVCLHLAGILR